MGRHLWPRLVQKLESRSVGGKKQKHCVPILLYCNTDVISQAPSLQLKQQGQKGAAELSSDQEPSTHPVTVTKILLSFTRLSLVTVVPITDAKESRFLRKETTALA